MSGADDLALALEFQRRSIEMTAEEVRRLDAGWVFRTPSLNEVWTHNQVWVDQPVSAAEAIELCERHLGDALFWQLFLTDEQAAQRVVGPLRADGWEVDVEVHMRLAGPPDRVADASPVVEPPEEEALGLMARWMREDDTLNLSAEGVRQTVQKDRMVWRSRAARRFGIRDSDGALAAITQLFSDGRIGQVEHVYTIPEARGRGYARALVSHAADLARRAQHELNFIVADAADWPQELYRKIGFEPIGRTWLLHLPPARVAERAGRG